MNNRRVSIPGVDSLLLSAALLTELRRLARQ
jgi:hypothetical protein